jgi:predicted GNAT family acetyltransferase
LIGARFVLTFWGEAKEPMMNASVRDNAERRRYEMDTEAGPAFATYRVEGDTILVTHSEVPSALRGRGLGDKLVRGMLDLARTQGRKVVPICSFVAAYMRRHPEYGDILA